MDIFAEERDKLIEDLEDRKAELMKLRYEEDVKLEMEFDEELARLMEKHSRISWWKEEHRICLGERMRVRRATEELDLR